MLGHVPGDPGGLQLCGDQGARRFRGDQQAQAGRVLCAVDRGALARELGESPLTSAPIDVEPSAPLQTF